MAYRYWIIRFVPNVARGEFSNIGIVCGRERGDWAVEFDLRSARSHGNLRSDLRELGGWISWFRRSVDSSEISSAWVEHLRSRQANSIQISTATPVEVDSARDGVELLFPRLVERAPVRRNYGLSRRRLRSEVRETLASKSNLVVGRDLFVTPLARIGKQRGEFDFLRSAGAEKSLTNVWAFNVATLDVLEREIQSWNYLVDRLRRDGASLTLDARSTVKSQAALSLPSDAPIDVIYDPPARRAELRRAEIFDAALEAWSLNGVKVRTVDDFRHEMIVY